jgi:hypothetical protein
VKAAAAVTLILAVLFFAASIACAAAGWIGEGLLALCGAVTFCCYQWLRKANVVAGETPSRRDKEDNHG